MVVTVGVWLGEAVGLADAVNVWEGCAVDVIVALGGGVWVGT